ncbi:HpcH/HpaI aldolase/citrate lyase family protein [Acuticoccus kandeliae]|uniref:HpcH/HpaI aldolase/citrate lyase family protein n=1 Tax=Acuticoccus kandeliae TaxID=2073160 RepID=UPI000D3E275C|nr:CoA ester lyase [Acuticoccus kandeliae]
MATPRSYLFVPGDRADRFAKAAASGADAIILDLEDAVAPSAKEGAREAVAAWFAGGGAGVVRINGLDTPFAEADLAMLADADATIMVPKASPAALAEVSMRLPGRPLIALVETVEGLVNVQAVATVTGVARLAFGNLDFGMDARIPGEGDTLDPARFAIAIASRHANLVPPVDGVTVAIGDEARLAEDVARSRRLGFTAKLCIHPKQVAAVNAAFSPSAEDVAWAKRVLAAVSEAEGVVQLDGKMVDAPVIARARTILEAGEGR